MTLKFVFWRKSRSNCQKPKGFASPDWAGTEGCVVCCIPIAFCVGLLASVFGGGEGGGSSCGKVLSSLKLPAPGLAPALV